MLNRAIVLGVGVLLATPAIAQETARGLTVQGRGEVALEPDLAHVTMGVEAEGDTPAAAIDALTQGLGPTLETLMEAGIEPRDIQTGTLDLRPIYADRDPGERDQGPRVTGYGAESLLAVRVRDLSLLPRVLDAAVSAGANRLQGLRWDLSEPQAAEDAALGAAVADAVRKGALMAEAAGVGLGDVLEITEGGASVSPPRPMMMEARAADIPLASGEVPVTATVTVRFGLVTSED